MATFSIITLGCKVNSYESQWYREQLLSYGLTENESKQSSDVVIINTCAVTNVAGAKSRQKIHAARKNNPNALLCVVGCYVQTNIDDLKMEDVDILIGTTGKKQLPKLVMNHLNGDDKEVVFTEGRDYEMDDMSIRDFNQTRAYLKIQDGCNQFCSYCVIPFARGKERSLPLEKIVLNAKQLVEHGHQELVLTGIHTGRYANDGNHLIDVIRVLLRDVPKLSRLRISSIEITEVTDEIIDLMQHEPRIAKHLHIPLQAGSNEVLKKMNRPYTIEQFKQRIQEIRNRIPDVSISTDVIVGFPTESDEMFEQSVANIKEIKFSFLHVFPFSSKKGTVADKMKPQISGDIRKKRVKELTSLSDELYNLYKKQMLNQVCDVIFETYHDRMLCGHTSQYIEVLVESKEDFTKTMKPVMLKEIKGENVVGEMLN